MILVNVRRYWPQVLSGEITAEKATLEAWKGITDESLDEYADVVLGIYQNKVVSAFDVTGWERITEGPLENRVVFFGKPSEKWSSLIGSPTPGTAWVQGAARPVKYLSTHELTGEAAPIEKNEGVRMAMVDEFILSVDLNGDAYIQVPKGKKLTVISV